MRPVQVDGMYMVDGWYKVDGIDVAVHGCMVPTLSIDGKAWHSMTWHG